MSRLSAGRHCPSPPSRVVPKSRVSEQLRYSGPQPAIREFDPGRNFPGPSPSKARACLLICTRPAGNGRRLRVVRPPQLGVREWRPCTVCLNHAVPPPPIRQRFMRRRVPPKIARKPRFMAGFQAERPALPPREPAPRTLACQAVSRRRLVQPASRPSGPDMSKPSTRATVKMSLSPRPHIFMQMM